MIYFSSFCSLRLLFECMITSYRWLFFLSVIPVLLYFSSVCMSANVLSITWHTSMCITGGVQNGTDPRGRRLLHGPARWPLLIAPEDFFWFVFLVIIFEPVYTIFVQVPKSTPMFEWEWPPPFFLGLTPSHLEISICIYIYIVLLCSKCSGLQHCGERHIFLKTWKW